MDLYSQDQGKAKAQREVYRRLADRGMTPIVRRLRGHERFKKFLEDVARRVERGERSQSTYDGDRRFLKPAAKVPGPVVSQEGVRPVDVQCWAEGPRTVSNSGTNLRRGDDRRGSLRDHQARA